MACPSGSEEVLETLKIFSYGSNMSSRRLRARVSSARFLRIGYVVGYTLRFHKRGRLDRSGKANMLCTGAREDRVWGVVREIDPAEKPDLDRVEGLGAGYEEERVEVWTGGGGGGPSDLAECVEAWAYIADPAYIDDALLPYDWYLEFVRKGAREHGLPDSYVVGIEGRESIPDPDEERSERNRRILRAPPPHRGR